MCGAFSFRTRSEALKDLYPWLELDERLPESFNIRPRQALPAVPNQPIDEAIPVPDWPSQKPVRVMQFGFEAPWKKGLMLFNTTSEKLLEDKGFWKPYANNRCLILADGFYEWQVQADGKTKQPFYFKIDGGRVFAFAGIYTQEKTESGLAGCASIITTVATDFVAEIHNTKKRMPVILPEEQMQDWVDPEPMSLTQIGSFLKQYPADRMQAYPVSKAVGKVGVDGPELVEPIETQGGLFSG